VDPIDALKRIRDILEGEAAGYDVFFVDDMIATASSLKESVTKAKSLGANDIWFACSLPLFTYPAVERIDELYAKGLLKGVIGTNAVYHDMELFRKQHPWYHEVKVEKYFADAMFNINHHNSISDMLK
jgi:ribose-phosphate pyrophosphokinase